MENRLIKINEIVEEYGKLLTQKLCVHKGFFYKDAVLVKVREGKLYTETVLEYVCGQQNEDIRDFTVLDINVKTETMAYAIVSYKKYRYYITNVLGFVKEQEQWKLVLGLSAETADPLNNWFLSIEEQKKEISEIIDAVNTYIEGIYTLDSELALSVFESKARMLSTDGNGKLADFPCTIFGERWKNICSASESGIDKYGKIENIRMISDSLAVVQVMDAKRLDFFDDFLSFAKINQKWMAVHKITRMPENKEANGGGKDV